MHLSLYHVGFLFIYLAAFSSLYVQVPGLYGSHGLTPIANSMHKFTNLTFTELCSEFKSTQSLLIFHGLLDLSPDVMMQLVTLAGVGLATLGIVVAQLRSLWLFASLWMLYLSCYKVGDVFMWFQWDILLLEAGFLTALSAPLSLWIGKKATKASKPSKDRIMVFLLRWLLFRLMFASGIVKLTSRCPTWWSLTALNYHYESQCIPTPLSWYAHQLPGWLQMLSVVCTYYIEILVPFFFLLPVRPLRYFAFLCQVFFQVCIILTGNYNFFNLLTIVLCLPLLWSEERKGDGKSFLRLLKIFTVVSVTVAAIGYSVYYTSIIFGVTVDLDKLMVHTRVMFSDEKFDFWLKVAVRLSILMAFVAFAYEVILLVWRFLQNVTIANCIRVLTTIVVGVVMLTVSLAPYSTLDQSLHRELPSGVHSVYGGIEKLAVSNHYGLFRRMTGVGGRPEVVLEGTHGPVEREEWQELQFFYKPGSVTRPPPFVFPHQPRLDWQMWFAALGSYHDNPWLIHLAYRLLVQEADVLKLMGSQPFEKPPLYIRALLYTYNYTRYDCGDDKASGCDSRAWWTRSYSKEYFPPLTWQEPTLLEFLKQHGYLNQDAYSPPQNTLSGILAQIRTSTEDVAHHVLVWSVLTAAASGRLIASLIGSRFNHH